MKQALVGNQLISASPDAPPVAHCPGCRYPVDLRQREETWFWRHKVGAPRDCPVRLGQGWTHDEPSPATNGWFRPVRDESLVDLIDDAMQAGAEVLLLGSDDSLELAGPGVVILAGRTGLRKEGSRE